ncbi:hypothetical protein [Desulfotalea psychrophila]|uniref:Uncharacterized protein n=1 Tax=Desulfotalea psychrophila (strain LSv54 / DSM 12343) TaxID=177439 RepID=Q6AR73_DESPS|nr:hypothetical protein [Desulfotalea psychrophila]CAG35151.1 unknown protein [Desulfotalea psychrophila LSv54]
MEAFVKVISEQVPQGYKEIIKLHLNGSNRVVTPCRYDGVKTWLDDSPKRLAETVVYFEALEEVARALQISPNIKNESLPCDLKILRGCRLPIACREERLDEDSCESLPFALFGKVEGSGTLSVIAFFEDGEEGVLNRKAQATVTNYEVEWLDVVEGATRPEAPTT